MRQLLRFGMVGTVGFLVDAAVLYLGIALGLGLYLGRVLSYLAAVTTTWVLNRSFTFRTAPGGNRAHEFARFAVSQLSGAGLNLGLFTLLVATIPWMAENPVAAVAAGSLAGLSLNFLVARRYVFTAPTT